MAGRTQPNPSEGDSPAWWTDLTQGGPARDPYPHGPYAQDPYVQDPYAQDPHAQDAYGGDPYGQAARVPTTTPEEFFGAGAVASGGGPGSGRGSGGSGRGGGRGGGRGSGGSSGSGGRRLIDYPRSGRRGVLRWLPSWKLVLGLGSGAVAAGLIALLVVYLATPIPTKQASDLKQTSTALYSDGSPIGQFKQEERTLVTLAKASPAKPGEVPDYVQRAVLASEDRSFYSNKGISPRGIVRAAWNNARGRPAQGGSTITQQYVKNFFLTSDRTVKRKAREFVISLKVAREVPKEEILTDYLNKIYFGRNSYGIQAGARAWFGKRVDQISVSEGAFLAGIINGPELYDPIDGQASRDRATVRWQGVINAMVEENWLPSAEAQKILAAGLPKVNKSAPRTDLSNQRGYLLRMIEQEARDKYGLERDELDTGGYLIRTTFDKKLIQQGIESVDEILGPRDDWPDGTEVGMVTLRPEDGAVLSIYAGDDKNNYSAVTQAQLQAGSTFKVFGLIAALEGNPDVEGAEPLSLRSRFSGRSPYKLKQRDDQGAMEAKNFGRGNGAQYGQIDLLTSTANSVNTVYAQLNERVTPGFTRRVAVRAGLPEKTYGLKDNPLNVLGSASPHVIDMASAYATIAAQGKRNDPYVIDQILSLDRKKTFFRHPVKTEQVFDPGVMADTTHALRQVVQRGSGSYAQNLGRPAAGKTGTSSSNRSAWFVGFTPQLVTAVGMYRSVKNDAGDLVEGELEGWGRYRGSEIVGGTFPVRLWTTFMKDAVEGTERVDFPEPVWGGETVNPAPRVTATPTPSASGPSPEPSLTDQPSPQPTEVSPSEPPPPSPTVPLPSVSDGGGGIADPSAAAQGALG
ncbi:MAG: penicillin-binding protein [Kineosporiaceae bacterium]|nr:penicillin-binding protein [Kineosporiaceae bacterium]